MKKKTKNILSNLKDFFSKEGGEVKELARGEESIGRYFNDSYRIFTEYFIPGGNNNFKPKILRIRSLTIITLSALFLKIALAAYLFAIYPSVGYMTEKIQDQIFELVNGERKSFSVSVVAKNPILEKAALTKANDMIEKNYFAHKNPDGKMVWDLIDRNEYPYLYVGENLAMNFTSANSAHKALMQSPSHKKNIVSSKYTEVGIAVVNGEINGAQTNVLVEVFAYPKTTGATAANTENEKKQPEQIIQKTEKRAISEKEVEKISAYVKKAEEAQTPIAAKKEESKVLAAENDVSEEVKNEIKNIENPEDYLKNIKIEPIVEQENKAKPAAAAVAKEIEVEDGLAANLSAAGKAIKISQYIFVALMIFLIISLLINILVRITIQHKSVIIQTLIVIFFMYGLLTINFHFIENITEKILIL